MGIFVKMAWRNIFRFKRRTVITFISSSLGLAMLILSLSLMNGIDKDSMNNIINSQQSHLTIFSKGYYEKKDKLPLKPSIQHPETVIEKIDSIPGVMAVEERIRFGATIIRGSDELPCIGIAVSPQKNPHMFNIKESLVEGKWLAEDEAILIGRNMADDMGLKVGDLVTLRLITSMEDDLFSWNAIDVTVRGIFDTQNPGVDRSTLFIPLSIAQKALTLEDQATEIAIRLHEGTDSEIDLVKKGLEEKLDAVNQNMNLYSWKELESSFLSVSEMKTRNSAIIIMVMLIIAAVGIVNTMLMAVMERTREIGMIAALGMKRREIMALFIIEGGIIGIIGSFFGCIIGGLAAGYFELKGLSLDAFGETMTRMSESIYPVQGIFYADLTAGVLIKVFVFGTVISLLASAWPARKAARMDPISALRHI